MVSKKLIPYIAIALLIIAGIALRRKENVWLNLFFILLFALNIYILYKQVLGGKKNEDDKSRNRWKGI